LIAKSLKPGSYKKEKVIGALQQKPKLPIIFYPKFTNLKTFEVPPCFEIQILQPCMQEHDTRILKTRERLTEEEHVTFQKPKKVQNSSHEFGHQQQQQ
jgi:hypothetical protein